jgi:hypothetical protein
VRVTLDQAKALDGARIVGTALSGAAGAVKAALGRLFQGVASRVSGALSSAFGRFAGKLGAFSRAEQAARGTPKALPAPRARGNPNPIGERGTFYVDSKGNVIPTPPGGRITGSPDGRFIQARDAAGNPTGVRIDGPHRPATHPDPRA